MSKNKTKHTPGPWVLNKGCYEISFPDRNGDWDGEISIIVPYARRTGMIVYGEESLGKEMQANARLIAAAPDMKDSLRFARAELVRLQGVVDAVNSGLISDVLRDIDESLAKAEGKS